MSPRVMVELDKVKFETVQNSAKGRVKGIVFSMAEWGKVESKSFVTIRNFECEKIEFKKAKFKKVKF